MKNTVEKSSDVIASRAVGAWTGRLQTRPTAEATARTDLPRFLAWPNYQRHLLRLGFSEDDFVDQGSDRFVSALYAIGDEEATWRQVMEHLDAGTDHVCVKVVADGPHEEMEGYWRIAPVLISQTER